ncbi:type VII secretion target [Cellulomonas sp. URHD0024]|uniref:type VII secretion target n=1 Tax=Cellulomonas sp. URHD0024 TaxID=1302620 RepID=UPI0012DDA035|nr:type VII secretion target [Cellulomonas sp. URHD0024]
MPELVVNTDAVRAHARAVRTQADRLGDAVEASQIAATPDSAFGLLCSFLVPPAVALQGLAAGAVQGAATSLGSIATTVDTTSRAYDAVDGEVREAFHSVERLLP